MLMEFKSTMRMSQEMKALLEIGTAPQDRYEIFESAFRTGTHITKPNNIQKQHICWETCTQQIIMKW